MSCSPQLFKNPSQNLAITFLEWPVTWQKFKILLLSFQLLSIKWAIKHMYLRFWLEIQVSVVSHTLWQCWEIKLFNLIFSISHNVRMSQINVAHEMTLNFGCKMLKNFMKASCSTSQKGSFITINIFTSSLWHLYWSNLTLRPMRGKNSHGLPHFLLLKLNFTPYHSTSLNGLAKNLSHYRTWLSFDNGYM